MGRIPESQKVQNLLTVDQAAGYLQLNAMTIRRMIERGELRGFRIGRSIRVRLEDLNGCLVEIK